MRLRACRVSSLVLPVVRGRVRSARVHSVFEHTVNILSGNDTWLCLHPREVVLHPYAVRIEGGDRRTGRAGGGTAEDAANDRGEGWRPSALLGAFKGEHVEVGGGSIVLGRERVRIITAGCEVWDPRPVAARCESLARARGLSPAARARILMDAIRGSRITSEFLRAAMGLARSGKRRSGVEALLGARIQAAVAVIGEVWSARRAGDVAAGMGQVMGLGRGLTPAGDDFLTGLLAAAPLSCDGEFTRGVFASLERALDDGRRTTTLPAFFMLKAALEGCYSQPLCTLVTALEAGSCERIGTAVRRLMSVGATSGQDMLAGVVCLCAPAAGGVTCQACRA